MNEDALERAKQHIERAREGRSANGFDAALDRARTEIAALSAVTTELESALPGRVTEAVQEGLRREVAVVGRNLAEIRGLLNNSVRRLERIEQEVLSERHARVDDLALLVDLVSAGWRSVDARLELLEQPSANGTAHTADRAAPTHEPAHTDLVHSHVRPFAADAAA